MRLFEIGEDDELSLVQFHEDEIPPYAILSHTWGTDTEEPTFADFQSATVEIKAKSGYKKIIFCHRQAVANGLSYFWIDTCCIDKSSSAELSEAINSMFQWYQNAAQCYVYLTDVLITGEFLSKSQWLPSFKTSRWFTRGWTLQELIAPKSVEFFSSDGTRLGDKISLQKDIQEITNIPATALSGASLSSFSLEERFAWAAHRRTKRGEDRAYSLLGIFDVFIPPIYGEGRKNAEARLRREISNSQDIGEQPPSYAASNQPSLHELIKVAPILRTPDEKRQIQGFEDSERMARDLSSQFKFAEAEKLFVQTLEGKKQILGIHHESTLATMNRLGNLYGRHGKLKIAQQMHLQALQERENLYSSSDHPKILSNLHDLGCVYREAHLYDEAEKVWTRALQGRERVLGTDHRVTLETVNVLGGLYRMQGMPGKAAQMHMRVLEGWEKTYGLDDKDVLNAANHLAIDLADQGKFDEAEPLYLRALEGMQNRPDLGPNHPETLLVHNNLSNLYQDQGRLHDAERSLTRAVEGYKKWFEPTELETYLPNAMATSNLGALRRTQKRFDEAEKLISTALSYFEQILGEDHVRCIRERRDLADTRQERAVEAQKTLEVQESLKARDPRETQETLEIQESLEAREPRKIQRTPDPKEETNPKEPPESQKPVDSRDKPDAQETSIPRPTDPPPNITTAKPNPQRSSRLSRLLQKLCLKNTS